MKKTYEAPVMEQMVIRFESNFMFSEGEGNASASKMASGSWNSWDE